MNVKDMQRFLRFCKAHGIEPNGKRLELWRKYYEKETTNTETNEHNVCGTMQGELGFTRSL